MKIASPKKVTVRRQVKLLTEVQLKQLEPDVRRMLAEDSTSKEMPTLSQRRQQVLRLVARGIPNQQIATELYISVNTVKTHMRWLLRTHKADDRSQLALIYVLKYQPAQERDEWRKEVTFAWPGSSQPAQRRVLWIMLSREYWDVTNDEIGTMLGNTRLTVKTNISYLMDRIVGWPRSRPSLRVAALLHLPK
ncbi:MAG TPA: LuxR C-terminal-related transcriptional regulator [Magnetospirillaceae bacterium]|nr:LuxR C-terminal-related transcriptional regulator [Magnetospirillaceae bacterium]